MKRILAAVGEDGFGAQVVSTAATLAKQLNVPLTICHVMSEEMYQEIQTRLNSEQLGKTFVFTHAEQRANNIAKNASKNLSLAELDFETRGAVGNPTLEIITLAKELDVNLIVMGFEGLHGLNKMRALGSVSRAVMEDAICPVMIVPLPADIEPEVLETEEVYATN